MMEIKGEREEDYDKKREKKKGGRETAMTKIIRKREGGREMVKMRRE